MAKRGKRQPTKPKDPQKVAEKRVRRDERKAREAQEKRAALRRRQVKQVALGAVGLVLVAFAAFGLFRFIVPVELAGVQKLAGQGRGHLAAGQSTTYPTPTPTSGTHAASAARCGISTQQIPAEFAVHALEHGAVVIWYQPELESSITDDLTATVRKFDDGVVLSPNAQLGSPIVATSWNRLKSYDTVSPEIEEFISTYRGRGVERVGCPF